MNVSTKQQRIAELAKRSPGNSFTSLNHYLDLDWMREAYRRVRKDSSPGYDGQTVMDYGRNLDDNLRSLLERVKSGKYVAPPVKRAHIPKGDGNKTRPIGLPTTEDKVLQRAVVMLLEPIYEQVFLDCSKGFRKGRSQHQALESLWRQATNLGLKWILDVDVQKFFDTLDHAKLQELLKRRVCDGVITRLIGKWLNAGVMEEGMLSYPKEGTPQGGVISPMLSNIYLHYVLDEWFEEVVKARMKGRTSMIRFADDFIIGFEVKEDAERVLRVLPKRFSRYGLTVHPDKTRLVEFMRPGRTDKKGPGTFNFLGFTHYWCKSRKGNWVIKRKTARDRFKRGLKRISEWCRKNRHLDVRDQHRKLRQKLNGHFAYFGITGNADCLHKYKEEAKKIWRKWLSRRSRGPSNMPWEKFNLLLGRYPLPLARVVHSIYK